MNTQKKKSNLRIIDSRGFWMVLSLLAAILLWMYVTSTEGVEVETTISGVKIEFTGAEALRESTGLIVTEQDISTIDLTLRSTRRVLSKLTNSNVTASIDLSRVSADGRYSVSYDIVYPSAVNADEITVVRSSADVVNFYVDRQTRKTIPVEGEFLGSTVEGCLADDNLIFDPMAVTISGPMSSVSLVDHAYIAITRTDVDKTLQYSTTYSLVGVDGEIIDDSAIILETEEIGVTLNVVSTKIVPLDVTIIDGGGATRENNTSIVIEPSSVLLGGDAAAIDSVSKITLGTIDLSSFAGEYTNTYTIVPPGSTENLSGAGEATVTVTVVGLESQNFTIGNANITCINVPDGYEALIYTQALTVTIRGPQEDISLLRPANLRAVADMSDIDEKMISDVINKNVRIIIDGFPNVGVIGEYSIFVGLAEIIEPEGLEG